ncbi:hypothetical protein, partial [Paraclostridium bifermentans]|uniref:hypothetical protein n=1 Tax=Paraclostridium bifermentans TaxID=1490 RepID=UPI00374F28C6
SKVDSISKSKYINGSYLWENIDRNIVKDFINNFNVYRPNPKKNDLMGIKSRMPIKFINTYINDININWDIALYSGEGKEKDLPNGITIKKQIRKIDIKDNGNYYEIRKRQVSSGNSESLPLSDEECKGIKRDSRKAVRERLKRPLLMLHILDTTIEGYGDNMELAAFGVSFPGRITSKGKTIKVKVNTVYIENLLKEEVYDD